MKTQVKLGLETMSAVEKIAFANAVAGALIANDSTFDAPPIAGADLMDFATIVSDAITAASAAKATYHELVSAQNDLLKQLEGWLRQTGSYVQNVSAGDAAIIQLAGLSVRNESSPIGQLAAPIGLEATPQGAPGMVLLKWKTNRHARSYQVQFSMEMSFPEGTTNCVAAVAGRHTLLGLASATRYWIRIAAINAAGASNWSNAVPVVTQ